MMRSSLFPVLLLLLGSSCLCAQNIEIEVRGIRSEKGQLLIKVFRDDQSFKADKPESIHSFEKSGMSGDRLKLGLSLEPGVYGLALVDDENRNGEMDYRRIGTTKEGFGFSDFYLSGLRRPDFSEFKFIVTENQDHSLVMKVRYM